jgi:hypothetical protein
MWLLLGWQLPLQDLMCMVGMMCMLGIPRELSVLLELLMKSSIGILLNSGSD